jgi:tRNA-(ms[2]io[6]A)-hydroxylase
MLGLKLKTDPRWAHLAQHNLQELLTDHAFCEQKAASNAISLIVQYPYLDDLVAEMAVIAQEEMAHFAQVHQHITKRGWVLGRETKDRYVHELLQFIRKQPHTPALLMDKLLFAAMIEARSCERFRLLTDVLEDAELKAFYAELMASEATHYVTFLNLARQHCGREATDARWQAWLAYEAEVISHYGAQATMHG